MSDLSPELLRRAVECESLEELRELCAEEGMTLSDDELEGLAGGLPCLNVDQGSHCSSACSLHYNNPCPGANR